jgi:hypothetical protein
MGLATDSVLSYVRHRTDRRHPCGYSVIEVPAQRAGKV